MQESLAIVFAQELEKISGFSESSLREISFEALPTASETWCIVLHLSGYTEGFCAITIQPKLAYEISQAILRKALGSFEKENIDETLCQNTIGELGNMALGEFFRTKKQARSTYIAAPLYSEISREKELLKQAEKHFELDVLAQSYHLSYLMQSPK